jgi:hypothetical protein
MLELGLSGSVRGVFSNGHPYREPRPISEVAAPLIDVRSMGHSTPRLKN